jgi:polysaccharide transporter, PST family
MLRFSWSQRPLVKKLIGNSIWILVDRMLRLSVGLYVTGSIAKSLGNSGFGQMQYILSLVSLLGLFSTLGLEGVVQAQIAQGVKSQSTLLTNALVLRLVGIALILPLAFVGFWVFAPSDFLGLLAGGLVLLICPFDIQEVIFHGSLKSELIVRVRFLLFAGASLLRIYGISQHWGVVDFLGLASLELALGTVILYFLGQSSRNFSTRWIDRKAQAELLKFAGPMLCVAAVGVVLNRIDLVFLRWFVGPESVGIYSVAARICEVLYVFPLALVTSSLSVLSQSSGNKLEFNKRVKELMNALALLSWILVIIVVIIAPPAIRFFFGESYQASIPILIIYVLALPIVFTGTLRNSVWVAQNQTRILMRATLLALPFSFLALALGAFLVKSTGHLEFMALAFAVSQIILNLATTRLSPELFVQQLRALFFADRWR